MSFTCILLKNRMRFNCIMAVLTSVDSPHADRTPAMVTVLTETNHVPVTPQFADGLWLTPEETTLATGWTLGPEGFCKADTCIPVPPEQRQELVRNDAVNVSGLWALMGGAVVTTDSGDVWFLGASAAERNHTLASLEAPDFTLPDFHGHLHSLRDFRRQRVLLITWASW